MTRAGALSAVCSATGTSSVVRESLVIEGAGYFGALGALALTYG